MAKVFTFPLSRASPEPEEQPFSLYQLMHGIQDHEDERTRNGDCYVTGIRFVKQGTPEHEELLAAQRPVYKHLEYTEEQAERLLNELGSKEHLMVKTQFAAVAHPLVLDETVSLYRGLDGCPYRGFITDFKRLAIIHPQEKRIAVVPFDADGSHRNLFYDVHGSKMAGVRWQYDGTIADALAEFSGTYAFDIGRNPRTGKEIIDMVRAHPKDHSRNYLISEEGVPLEKVLDRR